MKVERGAFWSAVLVAGVGCFALGWAANKVWNGRDYTVGVTIDGLTDTDLVSAIPDNLDEEPRSHRLARIVGREDLTWRYAAMETDENKPIPADGYSTEDDAEDDVADWLRECPQIGDAIERAVADGKFLKLECELVKREYQMCVWRNRIEKATNRRLMEAEEDNGIPSGSENYYGAASTNRITEWIGAPWWNSELAEMFSEMVKSNDQLSVGEFLELQYAARQAHKKYLASKETAQ